MSLPDPKLLTPTELKRMYDEVMDVYEVALDKQSRGWYNTRDVDDLEKWLEKARQVLGNN